VNDGEVEIDDDHDGDAGSLGTMEILLIEDGLLDARITIEALRRCSIHHRLTLVRSVAEAIAFLQRDGVFARAPQPNLVLLDLLLPDGDGISILKHVRSQEATADIPVVVLTAAEDDEFRTACEALSVDNYISKPVDEEKFMRVIREHKRLMLFDTPLAAEPRS
jgi:two-component system, chemotaxis family, response regulator Rcp1